MALAGEYTVVKCDDSAGSLQTFVSGDIVSVDVPLTLDQFDVTGFGDLAHHFINGQMNAPVTIRGYMTLSGANATHTVIKGAFAAGTVVTFRVAVGNNATPVVGTSPEYSGEFYIESYKPVIDPGKAVMFVATLKPALGTSPSWGLMA
jgi:hypothetical protein